MVSWRFLMLVMLIPFVLTCVNVGLFSYIKFFHKEEIFTISQTANVACVMFEEFDMVVKARGGILPDEDLLMLKKILTQAVGAKEKELSLVALEVMGVYDYYPNIPIPWDHLIYNMAIVCPRWGFNVEFFSKKVTMN